MESAFSPQARRRFRRRTSVTLLPGDCALATLIERLGNRGVRAITRRGSAKQVIRKRWPGLYCGISHGAHRGDAGFTLIELLIVLLILPLVMGGVAIALTTTLNDQSGISARYANSSDSQITSATFIRDVENAAYVTTNGSIPSPYNASSPAICGSSLGGTLVVGLYWVQAEATYWNTGTSLVRRFCQVSSGYTTNTVTSSIIVSHNFSIPSVIAIITPLDDASGAALGWQPTAGVSGVMIGVAESGNAPYQYELVGAPRAWTPESGGFPGGGSPPAPFLLLGSGCSVLTENGGAQVSISKGSDQLGVASMCPGAVQLSGGASLNSSGVLTADPSLNSLTLSGGATVSSNSETYASGPMPNPYASLIAPSNPSTALAGSCVAGSCSPGEYATSPSLGGIVNANFGAGTSCTSPSSPSSSGTFVFDQPVSITNSAVVTFGNGTYWFKGGLTLSGAVTVNFDGGTYLFGSSTTGLGNALTVGNGGSLCTRPEGVLFYIEGGSVSTIGAGQMTLSPMTQNQGVSLWDVAATGTTDPLTLSNGSSASSTFGGVYVPNGEILLTGAGNLTANFVVANTASISNGATLVVG